MNPQNSTNGTQPWQYEGFPGGFRGQRILAATIKSMNKYLGFGATQSTRLLFGGCTPGVVYNLDNVNNIIRGLGIKQEMVTVQGIFDSAVVLDVQPLSPTTLPLAVRCPCAARHALMCVRALMRHACLCM